MSQPTPTQTLTPSRTENLRRALAQMLAYGAGWRVRRLHALRAEAAR